GGGAREHADRDPGQCDVSQPVADQRQPTLHEVYADRGRRQSDEHSGDQRPLHELVVQDLHDVSSNPRRDQPVRPNRSVVAGSSGRWWWSVPWPTRSAARGGPSYAIAPSRMTTERVTIPAAGP